MFSNDIVGSDAFYEMPSTSQNLYFHLGMRCDDDGFVNPNVTMRTMGANKNDLDVLVAKKFLIAFANGVVVIKHQRINNNWDSRDCRRTLYTEELRQLFIKENNAYTLDETKGIPVEEAYPKVLKRLPDGNPTGTRRQNRIEENRITSERVLSQEYTIEEEGEKKPRERKDTSYLQVFELWGKYPMNWKTNRTEIDAAKNILAEHELSHAKKALAFSQTYSHEENCPQILKPSDLDRKWVNLQAFRDKRK